MATSAAAAAEPTTATTVPATAARFSSGGKTNLRKKILGSGLTLKYVAKRDWILCGNVKGCMVSFFAG